MAEELTDHNAFAAHAEVELGMLLALVITGLLSAGLGGAPTGRALVRFVVWWWSCVGYHLCDRSCGWRCHHLSFDVQMSWISSHIDRVPEHGSANHG